MESPQNGVPFRNHPLILGEPVLKANNSPPANDEISRQLLPLDRHRSSGLSRLWMVALEFARDCT
jgi:hypothetical protein